MIPKNIVMKVISKFNILNFSGLGVYTNNNNNNNKFLDLSRCASWRFSPPCLLLIKLAAQQKKNYSTFNLALAPSLKKKIFFFLQLGWGEGDNKENLDFLQWSSSSSSDLEKEILNKNERLNPFYVTGFADAESSFSFKFVLNKHKG
jgi:hypothetical protein